MQNTYFLILCGGGGQRLWPLSRKDKPKQFLSFLNNKSLLQCTIDRIEPLAICKENIGVVTIKTQADYIKNNFEKNLGLIIHEPDSRNTAPAILYSCLQLQKINKDAIVVFLASDTFVPDDKTYRFYLKKAVEYAKNNDKIVTLGVMPTRPATGYGYIQADTEKITCGNFYDVYKFHEKPGLELAQKYMQQDNMFWNIGVFVSNVSVFLEEFKNCASEIFESMQQYLQNKIEYKQIKNISVDYAVMEKSQKVVLLPCEFEWYDIGNLDVFLSLQKKFSDKNLVNIINIDSQDNLVQVALDSSNCKQKKLITFVGVNNLCLIEDNNVILVAHRDKVEKVKEALAKIKEESLEDFL
ncbi:MAG: mannose-1-phosphate guanylyltransferase [Candidatus Babeliales bacterium]